MVSVDVKNHVYLLTRLLESSLDPDVSLCLLLLHSEVVCYIDHRAKELCESRGGCPGLPVLKVKVQGF